MPADRAMAWPGSIVPSAACAIDRLLGAGPAALGVEAGLVGGPPGRVRGHGAAVHAAHQAGAGELGDVATDRHVRDVEALHEVRHAGGAVCADGGEDALLALGGEHLNIVAQDRTESNDDASDVVTRPSG